MLDNTPVVYSLKQGQWVDNYSASTGSSSSSKSSNIGIIAGAAGGVVAILVVVGVWWFCRRRRLTKEREAYESDARAAAAIGRDDDYDRPKSWASPAQGHNGAHRESQQFLSHNKASQYRDDYPLDGLKTGNQGAERRDGYLKDPSQGLEHASRVSGYSDGGPSFSDSSNGDFSRVATSSSNPDSGKGGSEYVPPTPSTAYNFTGFSGSNSSQPSLQMSPSAATGTYASFSPRPVVPSWFDNEYYQGKVSYYETESNPSATAFSPTASTARTSLYRGPHSPLEQNHMYVSPINAPQTTDSDAPSSAWGSPHSQSPPPQQKRISRAPQDYNSSSSGYYPPPPQN